MSVFLSEYLCVNHKTFIPLDRFGSHVQLKFLRVGMFFFFLKASFNFSGIFIHFLGWWVTLYSPIQYLEATRANIKKMYKKFVPI